MKKKQIKKAVDKGLKMFDQVRDFVQPKSHLIKMPKSKLKKR